MRVFACPRSFQSDHAPTPLKPAALRRSATWSAHAVSLPNAFANAARLFGERPGATETTPTWMNRQPSGSMSHQRPSIFRG